MARQTNLQQAWGWRDRNGHHTAGSCGITQLICLHPDFAPAVPHKREHLSFSLGTPAKNVRLCHLLDIRLANGINCSQENSGQVQMAGLPDKALDRTPATLQIMRP